MTLHNFGLVDNALLASDETPSRRAIRCKHDAGLQRALASLPEHYRLAIEFRHRKGLSFAEMACGQISPPRPRGNSGAARSGLSNHVEDDADD